MNLLKNQPKEKVQKVIFTGLCAAIAVGAIGQFYIYYQWQGLKEIQSDIVHLQDQIDETEQKTKQAVQTGPVREQMKAFVDAQVVNLVSGDAFAWVVREVSLLAEQHPVRVLALRPGQRSQHTRLDRYATYQTNLQLAGRYDQLGNFVRDLENRFPAGEVRALSLSPVGEEGELQATVEFVFVFRPESDTPKGEKAVPGEKAPQPS